MKRQISRMADGCVLTLRMSPLSCTTRKPNWWTIGWRKNNLPAQQIATH